jgi:cell division protein ZapB
LTEIRLPDYSAGMISEFASLFEKLRQLAEQSRALREENAVLKADNARLAARMSEAHDRVALLLDTMPVSDDKQEAA